MQSNRHRATHSAVIAAILFAVSLPLFAKQPVLRFEQKAVVAWVTPDADMKLDGHVRLLLPSMKAIGNAPPAPSDFQRDDVLIMVNPDTLDVLDVRISK